MAHTTRYAVQGKSRLAHDCGICRSTVSRLLDGRARPSYVLAADVTRALEGALGRTLDPRELFSLDGAYPTPSACALCGCRGGHPYADDDGLGLAGETPGTVETPGTMETPGTQAETGPETGSGLESTAHSGGYLARLPKALRVRVGLAEGKGEE